MKRFILVLLAVSMFTGVCVAQYGTRLGNLPTTSNHKVYNQSLPAANVIYKVTLEAGAGISLNVQAVGGDILYARNGLTTEAYWTIVNGATFWDHFPYPTPIDKELEFYTTSTSTPQVQVLYFYYL